MFLFLFLFFYINEHLIIITTCFTFNVNLQFIRISTEYQITVLIKVELAIYFNAINA